MTSTDTRGSSTDESTPPPGDRRARAEAATSARAGRFERSSLVQLTLVRFREWIREPEAVFWTLLFPILLSAGLGVAFRTKPAEVSRVAVISGAAQAAEWLRADPRLDVQLLDDSAAALALRTARVALVVAPDGAGGVQYRFDDARADARAARAVVDDVVQRGAGRTDPVRVRESIVRERGARYIDFVVPGLLGMNLMGSGIWGLGFGIVESRRKKLLKRLVATPMSRAQFLLSFLLQRLLLLVIEVVSVLGFGVLVFDVPLRGSLLVLGVVALLGALCFGALGLLIASRPKTMEGASGLMNLAMLPMWVFSGVFFSASNFPQSIQPFVQALPLTAVNDALRANMLQGAGWSQVGGELAIVVTWMVACFLVALRIFRWR